MGFDYEHDKWASRQADMARRWYDELERAGWRRGRALLGLDVEKLTPADDVLVGRASALRLLVADLESAQLVGRAIDVAKYVDASAAVEDILRRPRSSVM